VGCLEPHFWENFCRAVGRESLIGEQWAPPKRQEQMIEEIRSILGTRPLDEWLGIFDPEKICVAPVNTFEEALEDPHIRDSGTWFTEGLPDGSRVPQAALPMRFDGNRPGWRTPPPGLGEHTREILGELGIGESELSELKTAGII